MKNEKTNQQRFEEARAKMQSGSVQFVVELLAFGDPGELRIVEVPAAEMTGQDEAGIRELVFHYGQNDFQPQRHPSVSVGDVIRMYGERWAVMGAGFQKIGVEATPALRAWAEPTEAELMDRLIRTTEKDA